MPTNNSELFPVEMIRRMGYDPVTGKFVPGSPKRANDDLEARERSIRLLAERVKSPPGPMQPLSAMSPSRRRTIEVKGTTRSIAQPRASKSSAKDEHGVQGNVFLLSPKPGAPGAGQKWVSLDDGSSEEEIDRGSPLLSLSHQRAKILQETRARQSRHLSAATTTTTSRPTISTTTEQSTTMTTTIPQGGKRVTPTAMMILKRKPTTQPSAINPATSLTSGTDKALSARLDVSIKPAATASGADTPLHAPGAAQDDSVSKKKPRFVEFSDSE
jgi:hypothetical protein